MTATTTTRAGGTVAARQARAFRLSLSAPARARNGAILAAAIVGAVVLLERDDGMWITVGCLLMMFGVLNFHSERMRRRAEADRAPKLVFDREGMTIPDLFPQRLPWPAIERLRLVRRRHGDHLSLRVDDAAARGYAPRGWALPLWSLGRKTIACRLGALDGDSDEIDEAIRRFAPARLIEERPPPLGARR